MLNIKHKNIHTCTALSIGSISHVPFLGSQNSLKTLGKYSHEYTHTYTHARTASGVSCMSHVSFLGSQCSPIYK